MAYSNVKQGSSNKPASTSKSLLRKVSGGQKIGNLEEDHNDHTDVQMDKTELAFRLIDSDDDGYIDRDEFAKFSKNLSKGQIDKVWSKLDKDGDGRISISEFYDMMDKKKKKCEQEKSAK